MTAAELFKAMVTAAQLAENARRFAAEVKAAAEREISADELSRLRAETEAELGETLAILDSL